MNYQLPTTNYKLSDLIDQNNLHHAYLIEGKGESVVSELFTFLNAIGVETRANPDLWYRSFDTFKINDARALKEAQIQKGVSGEKKIFIIDTEFFTTEAQNALLKVFEEPASHVHFFIITPRADHLLKTLHSRLVIIRPPAQQEDMQGMKEAKTFIAGEKEDRLDFIKQLIKKYEKEETSTPLKKEALLFLNNIEQALQKKTKQKRRNREDYNTFEEIWKCRGYMRARGASVRMLLEHLALVL